MIQILYCNTVAFLRGMISMIYKVQQYIYIYIYYMVQDIAQFCLAMCYGKLLS